MNNLLIISIINCIVEYLAPFIIKCAMKWLYSKPATDASLRAELISIKQEMSRISMADEFSKYARLQRKHDKIKNELIESLNAWSSEKMKTQMKVTLGFRIINGLLNAVLLFMYRKEVVIDLPKDALWPLERVFSFPSHNETGISFLQWTLLSRIAISSFK